MKVKAFAPLDCVARGKERFEVFLNAYEIAIKYLNNNLAGQNEPETDIKGSNVLLQTDANYYDNLVFVSRTRNNYFNPLSKPIVYSSINKALKALTISQGSLMASVTNKYIFKNELVISFEFLDTKNILSYTNKPASDNQLRQKILLFNDKNEPVFEFNSLRKRERWLDFLMWILRRLDWPYLILVFKIIL